MYVARRQYVRNECTLDRVKLRWDKAALDSYYELTGVLIQPILDGLRAQAFV